MCGRLRAARVLRVFGRVFFTGWRHVLVQRVFSDVRGMWRRICVRRSRCGTGGVFMRCRICFDAHILARLCRHECYQLLGNRLRRR